MRARLLSIEHELQTLFGSSSMNSSSAHAKPGARAATCSPKWPKSSTTPSNNWASKLAAID
jgi:hypothetical protein